MDNVVIRDSNISKTAVVYRNVRITKSNISEFCVVGDDTDIVNCCMADKAEFGKRNIVRDVNIGSGSYTGTNTIIKQANIGKYSSISWNVSIGGLNHPYNNISMYSTYWYKRVFNIDVPDKEQFKTVQIGNDVWIGSGAIVLCGINIGDGAVIGAGSVVTKDIPPYSIVVGNPARVIKKRFSQEIIDGLLKIKWWDWTEQKIIDNIDVLRNPPSIDELKRLCDL